MEGGDTIRIIKSTNGIDILVDDCDYESLSKHNWHVSKDGYAVRNGKKTDGDMYRKSIFMHRVVIGAIKGLYVDHINGKRNDNQRHNLRVATSKQNGANRLPNKDKKYKGVKRVNNSDSYEAYIKVDGNYIYIGTYTSMRASANMYNHYALKHFGEFAKLNDVEYMSIDECNEFKRKNKNSYKGVYKKGNRFMSQITNSMTKKREYIGSFENELEACIAYNKRAIEIYGEDYRFINRDEGGEVIL